MAKRTLGLTSTKRVKRYKTKSDIAYRTTLALCLFASGLLVFLLFRDGVIAPEQVQGDTGSPVSLDTDAKLGSVWVDVPIRRVAKGEQLANISTHAISLFANEVTPNTISSLSDFRDSYALEELPPNLPITRDKLGYQPPEGGGVVERIPQGMRAITVRVDAESAVEGWARSGNFVDVIVLRSSPEVGLEAKVIAENVSILSAGRSTTPLANDNMAPQAPATVTLLVSQRDALAIKTAASVGRLTFSLRGTGDALPTSVKNSSQAEILAGAKKLANANFRISGSAQGPDGASYVLTDENRWIPASQGFLEQYHGKSTAKAAQSVTTAQSDEAQDTAPADSRMTLSTSETNLGNDKRVE